MRRLRESAGLTREQLAEQTGYKAASIKAFEYCNRTPTPALASSLDRFFDTKGLFAGVQEEAEQETTTFGELKESEQRAVSIRDWELGYVPGLLQTPRYASALLENSEDVDERMERQRIFERDNPPRVHAIISEGILYNEIGGPAVLREQLEHLIRPDAPWTLQVMPDSAGSATGVDGPLILLEFEGDEPAIAFLYSRGGGTVVDDATQVSEYWRQWECLTSDALSPTLSREMIRAVIAELPED